MSDHYDRLFELIDEVHPQRIMEIGTWDGGHAEQMIQAAQKFREDVEYYGFDLFAPAPAYELPKAAPSVEHVSKRLQATGAKVKLIVGNTRETLPEYASQLPEMDLIFIDGGHSRETIASDWAHAKQLMHERTAALLDDYYPGREDTGAKPLVDELEKDSAYRVKIYPPTTYPQGLVVSMVEVRCA